MGAVKRAKQKHDIYFDFYKHSKLVDVCTFIILLVVYVAREAEVTKFDAFWRRHQDVSHRYVSMARRQTDKENRNHKMTRRIKKHHTKRNQHANHFHLISAQHAERL